MVAISLYRGNLHRVPDGPRRWLMPTPRISLKDFKILLARRSRALSRLQSSTTTIATTSNANHNPNPNPNPNIKPNIELRQEEEDLKVAEEAPKPQLNQAKVSDLVEEPQKNGVFEEAKDYNRSDGDNTVLVRAFDESDSRPASKPTVPDNSQLNETKPDALEKPTTEKNNQVDALSNKAARKKEVEEKLEILNAKKHDLVQLLKQILNAEEELKRRSSVQGTATRPSVSLQVETTNTLRMATEANQGGYLEGVEAEDVSNHNTHSRHLNRLSSTSPSSESPLRKPTYNLVPHPTRASLGMTSGPSRFALTGQQGHPSNPPSVSVSGTNYIVSSPSPAASGGTSVFRDARLPSPWN